jgi:hypothetical protein
MTLIVRPGFQFDTDASTYIEAVEVADAQALETATRYAINDFVIGCKQDGIWSAIKASCILSGARTLAGALVPLVGTAPTNNNFVSGDYTRKTGLVGNGSTKYLDSNRANNTDPQNNKHIAVYMAQLPTAGSAKDLLGINFVATGYTALTWDDRATKGTQPWVNGASYPSGMVALSGVGFVGATRASSSSVVARINGTNPVSAVNSQTPDAGNIFVFGGSGLRTNARLAFYSIGESLDLALLDARVTALITAFGVAIP